jgi:uncharacterized protein (TIRG00374 family)
MRRKDLVRLAIGLLVSGVCLVLAGRNVSVAELGAAFQTANPIVLAPALGIYTLGILARCMRWRVLLGSYGVRIPMLFRTLLIGLMVNDILPGRLGEIARILLLVRNAGVPAGASLASVLIERLLDGIALTALLTIAILLVGGTVGTIDWLLSLAVISSAILGTATAVIVWAALDPRHAGMLARRIAAIAPARIEALLDHLIDTALEALAPVRSLGGVARLLGWSMIAWLLEAGMYLVIMLGFMIPGGVPAAIMGTAFGNLFMLVPAAPGGIGTFHFALKSVMEGFGADAGHAGAYTIVVHAMLIVPVVLAGLYFLWSENLTLRDLGRHPTAPPGGGTTEAGDRSVAGPIER